MFFRSRYPLSEYQDITPLSSDGHVVLVQNLFDGNLYVKKQVQCCNPELYQQLQENPVKNTPAIYGIYTDTPATDALGTSLILIEEYLPGSTLAEHLTENGPFSEKETIDIATQLCKILMDLHGQKPAVIHRDIKPSNIILSPEGTVKLLDFNAAKANTAAKGRDTVLLGTAGFAAPEQYGFSSSSPQTDIYAVGVLINVLLTGKLPSVELAGGKLKGIILRCLEVNPKDRYRNVKELHALLKRTGQVKSEWLLPGFRTLRIYKMLPAIAGYAFLIAIVVTTDLSSFTPVEQVLYGISVMLIGLLTIFFYCNYLNIRRWFPFMRSKHRWLRILGLVLGPVLIFWGVMILVVVVEGWLDPLTTR